MIKRIFDIISSCVILCLGLPFFVIIAILITLDSSGGIFFLQERIGKNQIPFQLLKFRTMQANAEKKGQLTTSENDTRITNIGKTLRKFKLDEFPQLINVLRGEMSVVGPRPEVKKYVDLYSPEQLQVLTVYPGLTDYSSIQYLDENKLLGNSKDPEKTYIREIMPKKLKLSLQYIQEKNLWIDLKIIFHTILKILKK